MGETHKKRSSMDPYARTCLCWPTSNKLPTAAQTQDIVLKIYQDRWMIGTEGQGNPC